MSNREFDLIGDYLQDSVLKFPSFDWHSQGIRLGSYVLFPVLSAENDVFAPLLAARACPLSPSKCICA